MIENFGYRQLVALWRTLAYFDLARRKENWGKQRRHGIGETATPADASSG